MTEERKEELRQLLQEAMNNLEVRISSGDTYRLPSMDVEKYKWHLRQSWASYSERSLWIVSHYSPNVDWNIESKLLEFIREELGSFIHEDKILSATFYVFDGRSDGFNLDTFLQHLLKITIFQGIEGAVSDLERSTKETHGFFQTIALLSGINLEEEIQVYEGVHLIPIPNSESEFPRYLRHICGFKTANYFFAKTLLVIDHSISPLFHKPFLPAASTSSEYSKQKERFKVELNSAKYREFTETDFDKKFCQVLSLVCNSSVQITDSWKFIAENEFFNVSHGVTRDITSPVRLSGDSNKQIEKVQIDKAKCLYDNLINPDSNVSEQLQIPIGRWIKSHTSQLSEDKIIDLGIAFESLYLADRNGNSELSFQLRLRASWFLGKDKAHRKELMKDFSQIYEWRSKVVHTGKLPNKTKKTPFTRQETKAFTEKAQDLCRQSIIKILENGKFLDWNNLILG